MATKSKLLQAAAGAASAAGGSSGVYVDDVFNITEYEGQAGDDITVDTGLNIGDGAADNTVFHLAGDTLTDSSPFSHTVTTNVSVNTGTKKYGTGSLYFGGSGDYLRAQDGLFILNDNDFTIEFWINIPNAQPTLGIFHIWENGVTLQNYSIGLYYSNNRLTWQTQHLEQGNIVNVTSNPSSISNATWHHVALVRNNHVMTMYIDGSAQTDVDEFKIDNRDGARHYLMWSELEIGTHWDGSYHGVFYLDDFRITRGTPRYTSNFTAPTAALPVDTATTGDGGMIWIKDRDVGDSGNGWHMLHDTNRGTHRMIHTNNTGVEYNGAPSRGISRFYNSGFSVQEPFHGTQSNNSYIAWSFKKHEHFFDVLTWTGDGTTSRTLPHNLNTTVGAIIVKAYNASGDAWYVWHRSIPQFGANPQYRSVVFLDSTSSYSNYSIQSAAPDSSNINLGYTWNTLNYHYVAYVFAHNDGDGIFGDNADEDIIKCGISYSNGTNDLGFEPEWLIEKDVGSSVTNWNIHDTVRTWPAGNQANTKQSGVLIANTYGAEVGSNTSYQLDLLPNGFTMPSGYSSGTGTIYIAIRRRGMKTPTTARYHFEDRFAESSVGAFPSWRTGSIVDWAFETQGGGGTAYEFARPFSNEYRQLDSSGAGATAPGIQWDYTNGMGETVTTNYDLYSWRRAKSFFDITWWSGNGVSGRSVPHNLGVEPEMMWVKGRGPSGGYEWQVYHKDLGATEYLLLSDTAAAQTNINRWNNTAPTATQITLGNVFHVNGTGQDFYAYLFATAPGVSKVGSLTVQSGTTPVDCGFDGAPRLIIFKRTDGVSGWNLFDSRSGAIVAGNDPYFNFDSAGQQVTGNDLVDPTSNGFELTNLWTAGQQYIFYAVA